MRERGEGANTRKWPVRICIGPRKTAEGQEGSSRERGRLPEAEKIPGTRFGERGGEPRAASIYPVSFAYDFVIILLPAQTKP